jgi:UDP-N-acetylmuramoylalanine--D-glutamate ligase
MRLADLKNKRVLVLGLGLHGGGVAVTRWLVRHGARVTVSDIKSRQELGSSLRLLKKMSINYVFGSHPASLLKKCDLIIQNPGVPAELLLLKLARQADITIENEASLFLKLCPSKNIIGITGSKGKSTTTALLGAILKNWDKQTVVAGNIRDTVMFQVLDSLTSRTPVVLELSSWHLELVGDQHLRVPQAVVTNVSPEHLNRYSSLVDYTKAKSYIFRYQNKNDAVILNYDNKITRQFGKIAQSRVYWFSTSQNVPRGIFVSNGMVWWQDNKKQKLFPVSYIKLLGQHNLENVLAAVVAARLNSVPVAVIIKAVKKFIGLHDRLELIATKNNVKYYNDTAATAPVATQAALRALKIKPLVLIAGGTDKLLNYTDLARDIKKRVAFLILLPGTATIKLQANLRNFKKVLLARNMAEAVVFASTLAKPGGAVLLSPGAASFGLFRHEFDRGEQFIKAVKKL